MHLSWHKLNPVQTQCHLILFTSIHQLENQKLPEIIHKALIMPTSIGCKTLYSFKLHQCPLGAKLQLHWETNTPLSFWINPAHKGALDSYQWRVICFCFFSINHCHKILAVNHNLSLDQVHTGKIMYILEAMWFI